ncbi:AAA family ATPase [Anatilimnocola sp. NA78]|uniref:AAA family ATPase n=1 Tax=Anatilimnocola sp. NA78 TaxID=3415683 RepID=UPI003CE50857
MSADSAISPHLGQRLVNNVLAPLKRAFVGKDEIIDLLGICLAGGENLFLLGPPGTAKSALVRELARHLDGKVFDYLLTRFTEPNELFGPFDIRKLREGELLTNTEGMLPEASLVFLDELLNANSAILNSLLMVLNERVFRRGRETRSLPTLMVVGASNRLPEDETLGALFDRFLLRVHCDNIPGDQLGEVLVAGWQLDARKHDVITDPISAEDVRQLQKQVSLVDLIPSRPAYIELILRLRQAGIPISDRRAVKLQRLVAASALLCGRHVATRTDLWVLRYIWDTEEQREVLAAIVQEAVDKATEDEKASGHPRSQGILPDPEALARDLLEITTQLTQAVANSPEQSTLRDQLSILASRIPWVAAPQQREHLQRQFEEAWQKNGGTA